MNDIVPRREMVKLGLKGVGGVGGGLGLFLLKGIAAMGGSLSIPGLIAGVLVTSAGMVVASSKEDRQAGILTAGAGAITVIASLPLIGGLAGLLMSVAGIGLIAGGVYSLYKFWKGIKSRG
jgi:hypothetical protein